MSMFKGMEKQILDTKNDLVAVRTFCIDAALRLAAGVNKKASEIIVDAEAIENHILRIINGEKK